MCQCACVSLAIYVASCICFCNSNRHFAVLQFLSQAIWLQVFFHIYSLGKVSFTDPLSKLFPFKWKTYQEHDWVRFMFRKPILNFRFCNFFHFHSPPHLKFISRMQTFKFPIQNAIHINSSPPSRYAMLVVCGCVCVWCVKIAWSQNSSHFEWNEIKQI